MGKPRHKHNAMKRVPMGPSLALQEAMPRIQEILARLSADKPAPDESLIIDPRRTVRGFPILNQRVTDDRFDQFTGLLQQPRWDVSEYELVRPKHTVREIDETRRDGHFSAVVNIRKLDTLGKPMRLRRLDSSLAGAPIINDFCEAQLKKLQVRKLISHALSAIETGYSVQELPMGQADDGFIYAEAPLGRPYYWYTFDKEWKLRFIPDPNQPLITVACPEPRILCYSFNATEGDRRGHSMAAECYWYVYFSKSTMKYGLQWLEQFGCPSKIARVPVGMSEKKRLDLVNALTEVSGQTASVIENDTEILFQQVGTASSSQMYQDYIALFNKYTSKKVVGSALVTEGTDGSYSSQGTTLAHLDKFHDITRADALDMMAMVNTVLKEMVLLNFGADAPVPEFTIDVNKPTVSKEKADVYHQACDRGIPIVAANYYSETGIEAPAPDGTSELLNYVRPVPKAPGGGAGFPSSSASK